MYYIIAVPDPLEGLSKAQRIWYFHELEGSANWQDEIGVFGDNNDEDNDAENDEGNKETNNQSKNTLKQNEKAPSEQHEIDKINDEHDKEAN